MRGGARRRYITGDDAAVSCPSERWGRRRTRVTECVAVKAEDIYTTLLEQGARLGPGWMGRLEVTAGHYGRHLFVVEVRDNVIWRFGRVFLRCDRCERRCARLYLPPVQPVWLACRRCWGLTYESRQHRNYKDIVPRFAWGLGLTHRFSAAMEAYHARERRRKQSRARWERRRSYLRNE